jgi:peptidoglycan/xylan/chitin deacetylase (PgdA/CDA1 family)
MGLPKLLRSLLAPALEPIGNRVLMSRLGDWGMAHWHGPRSRRLVALTFDDGPVLGGTGAVLDILAEHGVHATFFCIGANVRQHPELVRRAFAAGHVIGAHSMHHSRLATVTPLGAAHIEDCLRELAHAVGRMPALYRAPWGWMTPWEALRLRRRGLEIIRWDIETPDSLLPCPSGDAICALTLPHVRPGSILVFHDGFTHADRYDKPETVEALRLLIPRLRARGYGFATIPELLGIRAYQDAPGPPHGPLDMQHADPEPRMTTRGREGE